MSKAMLHKIRIPFKWVAITAYAIMIIPNLIFFFGWLKWYLAVIFSGILLFGAYWLIKKDYWNNKDDIEVPADALLIAGGAFLFWIFISGNCYTSVGSCDIQWRNATLRDLVNYDWPVYYPESGQYMCYYFSFWLVPALIGKIFGGVVAAFIAQVCWILLILMTVFLLISYYLKDYRKPTLILIIVFMVMWSGLTTLGNMLNLFEISANESYCFYILDVKPSVNNIFYRSNMGFFSQIYNQMPLWLAVPLFLQNRSIHSYAFLGLVLFPFSPWGTAGLALTMLADAVRYLVKNRSLPKFLKEVFSVANICGICSCFLVAAFFLVCGDSQYDSSSQVAGIKLLARNNLVHSVHDLLVFWICEFGLYYLFTWKKYKKDFLYWAILPNLFFTPFIWITSPDSRDFCMDGASPQLYILMIYIIGYAKDEILYNNFNFRDKFNAAKALFLTVAILASSYPISQILGKASDMIISGRISIQDNRITSFSDMLGYEGSFGSNKSGDTSDSIFFKYLAKPVDENKYNWAPISSGLSEIRSIDEFGEYMDYLTGKDCTVFIVSEFDKGYYLNGNDIEKLKQLGFSNEIDKLGSAGICGFVGMVRTGNVIFEGIAEKNFDMYYNEENKQMGKVIIGCAEWFSDDYIPANSNWKYRGNSKIKIDEKSYTVCGRGLKIAVYDNAAGRVIDSVSFDTSVSNTVRVRKKMQ